MINSFNQNELEEFRWYDITFYSEIKEKILSIVFAGEFYGAYPSYIEETLYFSTNNGESLTPVEIPFHGLFTLRGYLDFLNGYWLPGVKESFQEAIECAGHEPYCTYYDIYDYEVKDGILHFSLSDDCYPRVSRACSPFYEIDIDLDSIESYLSETGKYMLLESNYFEGSPIDIFLENIKIRKTMPANSFLFGKIDNKYPFSMAINTSEKDNTIKGYYYYDKNKIPINLNGKSENGKIYLTETIDNKATGFFELKISEEYDSEAFSLYDRVSSNNSYVSGEWKSPDKTKTLKVKFSAIK